MDYFILGLDCDCGGVTFAEFDLSSLHCNSFILRREQLYRPSHTNVLPFIWFPETQRAAFLVRMSVDCALRSPTCGVSRSRRHKLNLVPQVRPYLHSSLRERMIARPFLTTIEKKWLTYQLLNALTQCHRAGVVHGDIKSNNVLVTSWNWLVLTDFTGLKPTYLPEDNPADLSFFFDDDYDRRCYVAPERFYDGKTAEAARPKGECTPAMDMFSTGCVTAELFLDGGSLFQISQLLAYRKGDYEPSAALSKLDDEHIRDMVSRMIGLSPSSRPDVSSLMSPSAGVFPLYFGHLQDLSWRSVGSLDPDEVPLSVPRHPYDSYATPDQLLLRQAPAPGLLTGSVPST